MHAPVSEEKDHRQRDSCNQKNPIQTSPASLHKHCLDSVSSFMDFSCCRHWLQMVIQKQLFVGDHPVAEEAEEKRRKLQISEHILRQPFVIHWWHSIRIEQHCFLDKVKHNHRCTGDWEHDWDSKSIHEGHKGHGQNGRILEMHVVERPCIYVDKGLN